MNTITRYAEQDHTPTYGASRRVIGGGLAFQVLLTLSIVIVITILLLGQEETEVGMAP